MEARRDETGEWLTLSGYGRGGFRIGTVHHEGAIMIHRGGVQGWSGAFSTESLRDLLALDPPPEILLLGTGERFDPGLPSLTGHHGGQQIQLMHQREGRQPAQDEPRDHHSQDAADPAQIATLRVSQDT